MARRFLSAILFSLLLVVAWESVAVGDLLLAPKKTTISILQRDGDVILGEFNLGGEKIGFLANESIKDGVLTLDKLHIQEAAGQTIINKLGRQPLIDAAREYGRQRGVKEVIIQGGDRAQKTVTTPTGKTIVKPARTPKPIRIIVNE